MWLRVPRAAGPDGAKTVHQAALYFKRFKSLATLLLRIPNAGVEDHSSSTRRFERYGWFYPSNIETWR